jgi:hypothetical protein
MSASSPGDAFKNKLQGANSLIVVQIILGGGSENICVCILSNYFFCVFFFSGEGVVLGNGIGTLSSQTLLYDLQLMILLVISLFCRQGLTI